MERQQREAHWKELFLRSQRGDRQAYRELLNQIGNFSRSQLTRTHRNEQQIEDICQDILISVHKARHTYDPNRPFLPWVIAIIHFKSTDYLRAHYRRKKRLQELEEAATLWAPSTNSAAEAAMDVKTFMKCLRPQQRSILELLKLQGWSVREVADKFGISESNVKVIAHRAIKAMRQHHQEV